MKKEHTEETKKLVKNFTAFKEAKVIDENTPFVYLNSIVGEQLIKDEEPEAGATFHAKGMDLFTNNRTEFTVLLEKAGYRVDGLREFI